MSNVVVKQLVTKIIGPVHEMIRDYLIAFWLFNLLS